MIGKICGTGSYIPPKILSNNDLSEMVETNDEWIRERTGVRNRHIAEHETASFMAAEAAKRALENAGISPEEIDLILVASSSPDVIFPSVACEVQKEIQAVKAAGYDMQAACTGFVFACQSAQAAFKARRAAHQPLQILRRAVRRALPARDAPPHAAEAAQ